MGSEIHAVRKKNGNFSYREYSTTSDMYNTPELKEREITLYLLGKSINHGISYLKSRPQEIAESLREAEKDSQSLKKWDKAKQDYWGRKFPVKKTKKAFMEDLEERLSMPLHAHITKALNWNRERARHFVGEAQEVDKLIALLSNYQ